LGFGASWHPQNRSRKLLALQLKRRIHTGPTVVVARDLDAVRG
jgi:hypothetical protein